MKIRTIAKKSVVAIMICGGIAAVRPAIAFVWPVIDVAQVGSFVSDVSNGMSQVSNTKSQIDNATETKNAVGGQVESITKYAADLREQTTKVGDINPTEISISEDVENSLTNSGAAADTANKNNKETANSAVENVNLQLKEDAEREETLSTLKDAKDEIYAENRELNETYKNTANDINRLTNEVIEQLKTIVPALEKSEELTAEEKNKYKQETESLIASVEKLKSDAAETFNKAQEQLNSEYSAKVESGFADYAQSVNDYYDGKITREEMDTAGEKLREDMSSLQTGIADSDSKQLIKQAQEFMASAQKLQEDILNSQSNSREYSDEEESEKLSFNTQTDVKYEFRHSSARYAAYAKEIYFNKNIKPKLKEKYQIFGLSNELLCHTMKKDHLKKLEDHTEQFRECVTLAKAEKEYVCTLQGIPLTDKKCDPYELEPKNEFSGREKLYKPYRRDGVYDHIIEDYSIANIINNNRLQQFTTTWFEDTYEKLLKEISENQGNATVDNARGSQVYMQMIELEAPKLWSWIRVTDTLQRSKEAVQQFQIGNTLYLDARWADFAAAQKNKPGVQKNINTEDGPVDRQIFSHVFLHNCGLDAEKISVEEKDKHDTNAISAVEKNIAKCLYRHAAGASGRRKEDGTTYCGTDLTLEQCRTLWQQKEIAAINDSSFQTLTMSTINNYKSSRDYIKPKELEKNEINIASLQQDMKENKMARDDYNSGAQINYYSTMQILNIVDADAQNLQTEIMKYLTELDYNFFDDSYKE